MSSSDRSARTPQTRAAFRASLPRPLPIATTRARTSSLAFSFLLALSLTGCASSKRRFSPQQALDATSAQAAEVKTERGRAWITVNQLAPQKRKLSFPAVIAIDRTDPHAPLLRIECMDPLGATHALLILDRRAQLTWVDYDQRNTDRIERDWNGVPLSRLPELLLGFMTPPPDSQTRATEGAPDSNDEFEVRSGPNEFRFGMDWIDPGPRLAVREIEGWLGESGGRKERYLVRYSDYLDKDDFYLPREVRLKGFGSEQGGPLVEISVSWRERRWNEEIPMKVFAVPNGA